MLLVSILNIPRKYLMVFFAGTLAIGLVMFGFQFSSNSSSKSSLPVAAPVADSYDTITLAIVGDLMCHSQQINDAKKENSYDFNKVFAAVETYLSNADLTFGNLETVTAGEEDGGYTGYPTFNTPVAYLDALKKTGFDVLTNANNHSLDRRNRGVEKTIDALNERTLLHTGTFKTSDESNKILVVSAKGIKLAVLAYTFGTNGIPFDKGKEFSVNILDSAKIIKDVEAAKKTGADKILAFVHWGDEYQRQPNDYQKKYAGLLSRNGVDLILGSHPHVLQPMEFLKNTQSSKSTFCIYSMGNFISAQRKVYTDNGIVLRLQLIKNKTTGETKLGKIDFIPTYVSVKNGFRILPVRNAIDSYRSDNNYLGVSNDEIGRLEEVWNESINHLTDTKNNIFPEK
jgi:poly-gamma-glutamate synthesis protein (capsule biosynthesis protein)